MNGNPEFAGAAQAGLALSLYHLLDPEVLQIRIRCITFAHGRPASQLRPDASTCRVEFRSSQIDHDDLLEMASTVS